MAATRKQYTKEFKHEAVRLVTEQGLSVAQAARDLGLNDNVLSRWKLSLEEGTGSAGRTCFSRIRAGSGGRAGSAAP